MLSDLQSAVVDELDAARQADAGTDPAGRLVPKAVRPYGGEALKPKQLIRETPIVFVEFDVAALSPIDYGDFEDAESGMDVICATRNQASGQAEYSDGVALITWAFEQLVGLEVQIDGYGTFYWDEMDVGRMMSGKDLWVARVSLDFKLNRY